MTSIPSVLSVDTGPTRSGWALLAPPASRREKVRVLDYGMLESESLWTLLQEYPLAWLAIETPVLIHPGKDAKPAVLRARGKQLLATKGVASQLAGMALGRQRPYLECPATQWRAMLCGSPTAANARIQSTVSVFLERLPRTNEHVRDAIGLGLVALRIDPNRPGVPGQSSSWKCSGGTCP